MLSTRIKPTVKREGPSTMKPSDQLDVVFVRSGFIPAENFIIVLLKGAIQ